jgi:hypothetical protein
LGADCVFGTVGAISCKHPGSADTGEPAADGFRTETGHIRAAGAAAAKSGAALTFAHMIRPAVAATALRVLPAAPPGRLTLGVGSSYPTDA